MYAMTPMDATTVEKTKPASRDAAAGAPEFNVDAAACVGSRKARQTLALPYQSGSLRKVTDQVGLAVECAVTRTGGKAEVVC